MGWNECWIWLIIERLYWNPNQQHSPSNIPFTNFSPTLHSFTTLYFAEIMDSSHSFSTYLHYHPPLLNTFLQATLSSTSRALLNASNTLCLVCGFRSYRWRYGRRVRGFVCGGNRRSIRREAEFDVRLQSCISNIRDAWF